MKLSLLLLALLVGTAHATELRRLHATNGRGGAAGRAGGGMDSTLRGEKMSDAALATQSAILKSYDRGTIKRAAGVGNMMTAAATDPTVGHMMSHALEASNRRLQATGGYGGGHGSTPGGRVFGGGADSTLRPEKISDAALGTHDAILKAADRATATQKATRMGGMLTAAATDPTVSHNEEHAREGNRRMLGEGKHWNEGTMQGAQAATSAILKAVNAPAKGSVRYATTTGANAAHSTTNPESRFTLDWPLRRLQQNRDRTEVTWALQNTAELIASGKPRQAGAMGVQNAKAAAMRGVPMMDFVGDRLGHMAEDTNKGPRRLLRA